MLPTYFQQRAEPLEIVEIRRRVLGRQVDVPMADVQLLLTRINELTQQLAMTEHQFQELLNSTKDHNNLIMRVYEQRLREMELRLLDAGC